MTQRGIKAVCRLCCAWLAVTAPAVAQVTQPMGTLPRNHHQQDADTSEEQPQFPSRSSAAPAPPAAAQGFSTPPGAAAAQETPGSLLDKPAQPATVDLASGRLAIHADNSSLTEILHQLTTASGMTVDGLGTDQRVFGSYGPGDPQEVISSLLDGSGYNVMMLGRTQTGTPKQLSLTPRVARAGNSGPNRPQQTAQDEDNDDDVQQPPPPPETPAPQQQPPQGNPQQNGVRTPQQMLQELQQMRQQQQQQQQQQQPQPQP